MKYFKPTMREITLILLLALCATFITGFIPNKTTVYHSGTMGCEKGCEVIATGYSFAYIADNPNLSPVNPVDWIGALLGLDQFFPYWLALDFVIFTTLSFALFYGLWLLAEHHNHGSGRGLLAIISRIFNAALIIAALNFLFLALGVVTGMLFIPYYWIVLLFSLILLPWRIYRIVRQKPTPEPVAVPLLEATSPSHSSFAGRFGISALFVLATLMVLPFLWLRGGLFQEPLDTAISTVRLELSGDGWRTDVESGKSIIKSSAFKMYLAHLEFEGWKHVDQMGSGYLYERDGERTMLVCRLYSTRYRICSGGPAVTK